MITTGSLAKLVRGASGSHHASPLCCRPIYRHNNSWWYSQEDFMTASEGDIALVLECDEHDSWAVCLWNERYVFIQTVDLEKIET